MKFKPEDFQDIYKRIFKEGYLSHNAGDMWEPEYTAMDICKIANAKLEAWLKKAPTVYFNLMTRKENQKMNVDRQVFHTHQAKLVQIEEIE